MSTRTIKNRKLYAEESLVALEPQVTDSLQRYNGLVVHRIGFKSVLKSFLPLVFSA